MTARLLLLLSVSFLWSAASRQALAITVTTNAATGVTDIAAGFSGTFSIGSGDYAPSFEWGTTTDYELSTTTSPYDFSVPGFISVTANPWGLLPDTTYHFRLRVYDYGTGIVTTGNDLTFTTGAPNTPPVVTPTLPAVVFLSSTTAEIQFAIESGSSATTELTLEYGASQSYGASINFPTTIPTNSRDIVVGDLSNLLPNTVYHYRCKAVNGQGTTYSPDATFTTLASPVLMTNAATGVTDLGAVLNATFAPNGSNISLVFEYGTTSGYGSGTSASTSSVSGSSLVSVNGILAGLLPNTTYHFRIKGHDNISSAFYFGADSTFTTGAPATPPTVSNVSTSGVHVASASVQCTAVTAGSSDATVVWEYGTTSSYGNTAVASPSTVTLNSSRSITGQLSGLSPGTTYHYRCSATNSEGTGTSADATFTTMPGPALTTTDADGITDLAAMLHGNINPNGESYAVGFEFGTDTNYGRTKYGAQVGGNSTVAVALTADSFSPPGPTLGLLPSTTYHYRLFATGSGNSFHGSDKTFTTGPPATPPGILFNIFVLSGDINTTSAPLHFSINTGSSPATVFIDYGTTAAYGSVFNYPASFPASSSQVPTTRITGLQPSTTYHYRITASNTEGTSVSADKTFTTANLPTFNAISAATGSRTAALSGSFNPENVNYTSTFEYGPTTSYGFSFTSLNYNGPGWILGGIGVGYLPLFASGTAAGLLPQNTYHFLYKLTDSDNVSYYSADSTFTTVTPVEEWRSAWFNDVTNTGDGADSASPASDGIPNLLKYALALFPFEPSSVPQAVLKDYGGSKFLSITFDRNADKSDINYEVQVADGPDGPWTTIASSIGGAPMTGPGLVQEAFATYYINPVTVGYSNFAEVRDVISTADAPRRFMRLKVSR